VQRELPDFFIFDYKHLFRQIFWTKISVWIFHWDCNKSEFDLDVMVDIFTAVKMDRFALSLTPRIMSIIRLKNSQRHRSQRARLTGNRRARDRAADLHFFT
jgi:hypothetical protein